MRVFQLRGASYKAALESAQIDAQAPIVLTPEANPEPVQAPNAVEVVEKPTDEVIPAAVPEQVAAVEEPAKVDAPTVADPAPVAVDAQAEAGVVAVENDAAALADQAVDTAAQATIAVAKEPDQVPVEVVQAVVQAAAALQEHIGGTDNPHQTTVAQAVAADPVAPEAAAVVAEVAEQAAEPAAVEPAAQSVEEVAAVTDAPVEPVAEPAPEAAPAADAGTDVADPAVGGDDPTAVAPAAEVEPEAAPAVEPEAAPAAAEVEPVAEPVAAAADAPVEVPAMSEEEVAAQQPQGVVAVPEDTSAPAADSLETELLDVARAEGEVKDADLDLEEVVDTVKALESYIVAAESAMENGGFGRDAATFLNIAIEGYRNQLGVQGARSVALENFGGASSKMAASAIAMEDMRELLNKGYERVLAMLAALKKAMAKLWDQYFSTVALTEKRLARIYKEQQALKSDAKPSQNSFNNAAIAGGLYAKGGVTPLGVQVSGTFVMQTLSCYGEQIVAADRALLLCRAASKDANYDKEVIAKAMKDLVGRVVGSAFHTTLSGRDQIEAGFDDKTTVHASQELSGNKIVYAAQNQLNGNTRFQMDTFADVKEDMSEVAIPVLTPAQMLDVIKGCGSAVKAIKENQGNVKKAAAVREDLIKLTNEVLGSKEKSSVRPSQVANIAHLVDQPFSMTTSYGLRMVKYALDWVDVSMRYYKSK